MIPAVPHSAFVLDVLCKEDTQCNKNVIIMMRCGLLSRVPQLACVCVDAPAIEIMA